MINFQEISLETFLTEYWQKKPVVIRNALPGFVNHLAPDELAGLALEDDIESRMVFETPEQTPQWHLKRGPFTERDFTTLPSSHWTLLVQGVDRLIPEIYALLNHFDFIPQWRIDDIMISYAALKGSVGPHYDNYDVFLYQAMGTREWSLTSQHCTPENYIPELELRIMDEFNIEQHFMLEEGDMLYLPPHIGHYGIAQSQDCMTYSFGYRSYQGQELWDSLGEHVSEHELFKQLYQDPNWSQLTQTAEIQQPAWQQAQVLLKQLINDKQTMKSWFGCFATRLDQQAEQQLPAPIEEDELPELIDFIQSLKQEAGLERDPCCRFAYQLADKETEFAFYINGCQWQINQVSPELLIYVANNRFLSLELLDNYLINSADQSFIFDMWRLQWLHITE